MDIWEVLLVSVGLSLDVFTVVLCKGAMLSKIEKSKLIKLCIIFVGWQVGALLLGNMVTSISFFSKMLAKISLVTKFLAILIFIILGIYMIYKGLKNELIFERREDEINYKEICLLACITSLDAFFAGIGFSFLEAEVIVEAFIILIITVIVVILGIYIGYRMGYEHKTKAYIIGGILLIVASVELYVRYL